MKIKRDLFRINLKGAPALLNVAAFFAFFAFTFLTLTGLQIFNHGSFADTDIAAIVTQNGYYSNTASDSIGGSVNMNVNATPSGSMTVAKDTLNIKSNVPDGYNVYIAMKRDETCVSDCNALKKEDSAASIPAVSGTFDSPAALSANTWGYAISKNTIGAPANNFDTSYDTSVPDDDNVFAALPTKGNDQLIQSIDTPDSTDGIDAEIYYGINVNTAKESGIYRGTISYSIVAKNASGVAEIASVSPESTDKLEGGEELTISTNYTFSPENAGNVEIYVNSLTESKACTNVTKATASGALQFTCIAPSYETGKYDVRIVIPSYGKDVTLTHALTYYVDSTDAKNLRNAVKTGFNPETLESNVESNYYNGDTIPLSDLVDVYSQDYDETKTEAQNTEDAGITKNDDGTYKIEAGYHAEQNLPASGGGEGDFSGILTVNLSSSTVFGYTNNGYQVYGTTSATASWAMTIIVKNSTVLDYIITSGSLSSGNRVGSPTTDSNAGGYATAAVGSRSFIPASGSKKVNGTVRISGTSNGAFGYTNNNGANIYSTTGVSLGWTATITIANNAITGASVSPSSSSVRVGSPTTDSNAGGYMNVTLRGVTYDGN